MKQLSTEQRLTRLIELKGQRDEIPDMQCGILERAQSIAASRRLVSFSPVQLAPEPAN
jgi:hypothetical protein